jgi:hypothetical protein
MPRKHSIQRVLPKWLQNPVPVGKMHAAPERQVQSNIIDRRRPLDAFGAQRDGDGDWRRVDERGVDIDRAH